MAQSAAMETEGSTFETITGVDAVPEVSATTLTSTPNKSHEPGNPSPQRPNPDPSAGALNTTPPPNESDISTSKGINIGVIVGIVIVCILSLIAVGFCLLDGRRRIQRWKEKRKAKADAECQMWQTELENGRSPRRDSRTRGLWDGLRVSLDATRRPSDPRTSENSVVRAYERRLRYVGMNEAPRRVRFSEEIEVRPEEGVSVREEVVERPAPVADPGWLPQRERESIVSSVGSSPVPGRASPVVATSFLDRDALK